jgi:hypothetical protein
MSSGIGKHADPSEWVPDPLLWMANHHPRHPDELNIRDEF